MSGAAPRGRLLVVTSNYPRWAGDSTTPFVADLTRHLVERGWAADVIAPHDPDAARDETLDGIERVSTADVQRVATDLFRNGSLAATVLGNVNGLQIPVERLDLD